MLNAKGALVVKQGTVINKQLATKIVKHKLLKPLEQSVALSNTLTFQDVALSFKQRLIQSDLLNTFTKSPFYYQAFEQLKVLFRYPLLIQKVTVLSEQLPEVYANTLVTSILSYPICQDLGLDKKRTEAVFLACIISNASILHIDPAIVSKSERYTNEEWNLMKGHVVISKHFADLIPDLPKNVGRAVLEHHERADGFGYPFGKQSNEICTEAQIVSIIDTLNALYKRLVKHGSYSWPCVIGLMRLPNSAHIEQVRQSMLRVLLGINFTYKRAFDFTHYPNLIENCIEKRNRLKLWFDEFEQIYTNHKDNLNDTENFKPLALLQMIRYVVADTGVLTDSQHKWLMTMSTKFSDKDCLDLEEFDLLLNELDYQAWFVMRKFVADKDLLVKAFGDSDLPVLYYKGLQKILGSKL